MGCSEIIYRYAYVPFYNGGAFSSYKQSK
uniref:Uncharacterized protein n=1 Tax=Arundo donax TaxID=35708 RepID=A0A0A8YU89_ARUDO